MSNEKPKFFCGAAGAFMCETSIPKLTQKISDEQTKKFYGGEFFIGESMNVSACRMIAKALGGEFVEKEVGT